MRVLIKFLLLGALTIAAVACHDVGDVKVISLSFDGAKAFDSAALRRVLATRESGWLPWSPKHYFDRAEFESDLKRIVAFYADRGFPDARIKGVDVKFNDAKDAVRVTIAIDEGAPVIVEAVRFEGFDLAATRRPGGARIRCRSSKANAGIAIWCAPPVTRRRASFATGDTRWPSWMRASVRVRMPHR